MENKEYLLITEDGYEVKEKENVSWIINDEYKYELTLCENHKTLIENSEGVYKVFKIKEKALEYHNKMLLSKNSNLPLTEQLQKAEAVVKRLKYLIEEENKIKVGDWCIRTDYCVFKVSGNDLNWARKHSKKITDQQLINKLNELIK